MFTHEVIDLLRQLNRKLRKIWEEQLHVLLNNTLMKKRIITVTAKNYKNLMNRSLAFYKVRIHMSKDFNQNNFIKFVSFFDILKTETTALYASLVEKSENLKISNKTYVERSSDTVLMNKFKNANFLNIVL